MPRQPRLDAPGILQHVMARGIERRLIFIDDPDRKDFLAKFAQILEETQTQFHNRYKSVVCEENTYLLELIRYIYLNPLRAKLVSDMNALDVYPWTSHSTLMGNCKNPLIPVKTTTQNPTPGTHNSAVAPCPALSLAEKTVDDVLRRFGEPLKKQG